MKIISKYNDYYDMCEYLGVDPKCVFVRQAQHEVDYTKTQNNIINELYAKLDWRRLPRYSSVRWYNTDYFNPGDIALIPNWIAFCGRIYIVYLFKENKKKKEKLYGSDIPYKIITDLNEVIEMLDVMDGKRKHYYHWGFSAKQKKEHLLKVNRMQIPNDLFIEFDSPIISSFGNVIKNNNIVDDELSDEGIFINPRLVSLGFQKILDAQQAWQELSMFLMGILKVGETETVDVDDKYKIIGHGYDKHSFRNTHHRNKPRGRKRRNK